MNRFLRPLLASLLLLAGPTLRVPAADASTVPLEPKPADAFFARFEPHRAPAPGGLWLREGDRLAVCGDSITEQKMYSRIMETYLTACVPQLKITVRQYGWGGETAEGFLRRMTNDCLRFQPTVATTCYGMNDHRYQAYDEANGQWYRTHSAAILQAFLSAGARVVQGSPGCVGPKVPWGKAPSEEMNLSLCQLRNLGLELAVARGARFADVFWPMFTAGFAAQQRYGPDYLIAGRDGVHPDWAGHLVMAYAFLRALGLDGQIGTIAWDAATGQATATDGHEVQNASAGEVVLVSRRYPFCAAGNLDKDNSIRSGMTLVPFNAELNRFMLVVKHAPAAGARVTWGSTSRDYTAAQLAQGVNLADDFATNPFSDAFNKLDAAVAAKQAYETRQVKLLFHGDEGHLDMPATVALTEKVRAKYVRALADALVPVQHTLRLEPKP